MLVVDRIIDLTSISYTEVKELKEFITLNGDQYLFNSNFTATRYSKDDRCICDCYQFYCGGTRQVIILYVHEDAVQWVDSYSTRLNREVE